MLTVEEIKKTEGTLITLFLALSDALQSLDVRKNQGKKNLESLLDMQTQKNVLNARITELGESPHAELYARTIAKIESAMVDELTHL